FDSQVAPSARRSKFQACIHFVENCCRACSAETQRGESVMLHRMNANRPEGKPRSVRAIRPSLEHLEDRIVPSYADGNGAVILSVTSQAAGSQLVLTFDGPLNS